MRNRLLSLLGSVAVFNAEGLGGGGGEGDGGSVTPPSESILYPNEGKGGDEKPADPPAGDDKGGGDWKEYDPDPNKTDEENAAAKAEHDKSKPDDKSDDPADKVPEDGKYSLTMPDGVELDQELLDAVGGDFKELGLTNKQAQALADKFIKVQQDRTEKQMKGWGETVEKWASDAKSDKEMGGVNWDATSKNARRAVEKLGTPELGDYLNASGGGNHPELIRFMAKVGAMIKEDNPASGGAEGAGRPVDPAHVLYPNDAPKG